MPRGIRAAQIMPISFDNEDVATIISIVPFMISEFKPGIYPGRFVIPGCLDYNKPEVLLVGTSVHFVPQYNGDEELPAIVIKTNCREIADAVVKDYLQGQMDVDAETQPGILWLPGNINADEFRVKHIIKYNNLKKFQSNWFRKLVQRADNDWNRYKRHTVISENQRFAGRALGMEKEWLLPEHYEVPVKCPSCLTNCAPEAVVCANCRCILKPEEYKKLTFAA